MSSSQSRSGGERMIHQDYIARIRYSNALPPPPNPPKLLDIPNTGLSSGLYTAPSFASRLAREQPLNIEADAELGMPLDLVGMPGVFDGDESSIQAPAHPPPVHPHDRALLRPLNSLGKPKMGDATVSFLRRTEYISSSSPKPRAADNVFLRSSAATSQQKRPEKRKASPEPDKGTPAWIRRRVEKSFEIATSNLADRGARVKHPSKRNLKVVDALPLLPDLEAFPDSGAYVTVKFNTNPVASSTAYDTRLLSGVFMPIERTAAEEEAWEAMEAAHKRDPRNNPKPSNMMNYNLFLADSADAGEKFRKRFDVDNPDNDDESLYTAQADAKDDGTSGAHFRFPRIRAYETSQEKEMDHTNKYDDEVILVYRDDETETKGRRDDSAQKAVYYYPIMQRSTIRSQRTKNIARTIGITDEDERHPDEIHVRVGEPSEAVKEDLQLFKQKPVGYFPGVEEEEEEEEGQGRGDEDADGSPDGDVSHMAQDDAEGELEDED